MKIYNIKFNLLEHINILIKIFKVLKLNKIINYIGINIEAKINKKKCLFKPYSSIIEPTRNCNLNCKLCLVSQINSNFFNKKLELKTFKNFIDQNPQLIFIFFAGYGEPCLNENLHKMINYANKKNIITILSTNGTIKLNKIKPDFIIFSLDYIDNKKYLEYKGRNLFNVVINNIIKFNKNKKKTITLVQYLINSKNKNYIDKIIKFNNFLKCDFTILKNGIIYTKKAKKFEITKGIYKNSTKDSNKNCKFIYYSNKLNHNGTISPCCLDINQEAIYGRIKNNNLSEYWNSIESIKIRTRKNNIISECKACHKKNNDSVFLKIIPLYKTK